MNMPIQPARRGKLIAIGGAEDKATTTKILQQVVNFADVADPRIGVITTASAIPDDVFAAYKKVFDRLGAGEVIDIRVRERADAAKAEIIEMITQSDIIFISGGDQMRLTSIFGGSDALAAIRKRHDDGGVIAGTSAGAACQSTTMVYGGNATDSLRKGAVKMTAGFGLIDKVIIDTHFLERGRFSRLMEVGATNPEYLGVGLGEDAAVLFAPDTIHAFGPGHVILVDSSKITGSNVFDLDEGETVSVHNVIMHALVDGNVYSLSERRILSEDELGKRKLEQKSEYT